MSDPKEPTINEEAYGMDCRPGAKILPEHEARMPDYIRKAIAARRAELAQRRAEAIRKDT